MKKSTIIILLIVIVLIILVVSFVISTKNTMDTIDYAKSQTSKSIALGFIDIIENTIQINELDNDTANDISDGTYSVAELIELSEFGSATLPSKGWLTISDKKVVDSSFLANGYVVDCEGSDCTVSNGDIREQP